MESAAKYDASTIKSVQENRCGLIMQVPTCFYNDLACNTDERTLFAFSDLTTQNITNYAGNVWSIFTLNENDGIIANIKFILQALFELKNEEK